MNKKRILIGALGLLWIFGVSGQAQPLAQYTFNDGTPGDVSGNSLDGVLLGNAAVVTDPERGQVMQINGRGMQVDGPFDITTAYTLSVWVKLDQPLASVDLFGHLNAQLGHRFFEDDPVLCRSLVGPCG